MTKYALFTYKTNNVGDDIQSLAAKRFLPQVDYYINRDYLNDFTPDTNDEIKCIMNGWYTHRPNNFPWTLSQANPLITSIYVVDHVKNTFSSKANVDFFKKHEPIGARSIDTKYFFDSLGIQSYFSGCMTLTLKADPSIQKRNFIIALNVSDSVFNKLKKDSYCPVIRLNAEVMHQYLNISQRFKIAQYYLYLYQSAKCVVTTKLHGTLPCLALGTPVLNISLPGFDDSRFTSLRELAHNMTEEEFLNGKYDINNPLPNPDTYLEYRNNLEQVCSDYTGYISSDSFLSGETLNSFLNDPELIQCISSGFVSSFQKWGATN